MPPSGVMTEAASKPQSSRIRIALRSLRHRNFKLFFAGQFISLIGTWMQSVAQSWLVYRLTGSSVLLGGVGFAGQVPVFLFAIIGGTVSDRYSRHRLVITTQTASMLLAFALSALTLTHQVRVWHIFVLAALLGTVNSFDIPARQSFMVEMVGKADLINAIALNSSVFNSARIIGPAVAGLLVAGIGEGWCFFANGLSYIAVIIGLLMMNVKAPPRPRASGSALSRVLEGFRFVRGARPIRWLLTLLGVSSLAGMPYAVLMPIFADQVLHGGARGLGILMGATGVGAVIGALSLAVRSEIRGLGRWVGYSCAGFGISLILFAWSRVFWLSAFLLVPIGLSLMLQMGASNTLIQAMVPDHLRGRVMAVYSMMFMGVAPFGAFLAGLVAEKLGAPLAVTSGGLCCIAASIFFLMRLPSLRAQARQLLNLQQEQV